MSDDKFMAIQVGDEAEIFHTITFEDVDSFAKLTGDDNPLHMCEKYAATTHLKKRVVHGMLTASFISTMIGTRLPGEGSLWYEQSLKFLAPVRIGERIRIFAKVIQKSESRRVIVLQTMVYGEHDRIVIEGEGKVEVMLPNIEKNEIKTYNSNNGAVIITGASRGIGASVAFRLAEAGHKIIINYKNDSASANEVQQRIVANGGEAIVIQADVTSEEQVSMLVAKGKEEWGVIDGIVNNATGDVLGNDFHEMLWSEVQSQIDVHIKGAYNLCKLVIPHFIENQKGAIVNIGSVFALNTPPAKMSAYCLCKAALSSMTRSMAVEYGPKGIRANMVSPGMTQTDLIANVPSKAKLVTKMQTPLRQLADPRHVANAVAFLISDDSFHITGQNLSVNGGIFMNT